MFDELLLKKMNRLLSTDLFCIVLWFSDIEGRSLEELRNSLFNELIT